MLPDGMGNETGVFQGGGVGYFISEGHKPGTSMTFRHLDISEK
jgi:hypothetical protein